MWQFISRLTSMLLAGLLAGLLSACGSGPDAPSLRRDIEARMAAALPAGMLVIEALHPRGTQKDVKGPPGESRRVVYFDADLKLAKDYNFGAWDSPGVAGLVSALGTGPKGIMGIVSGGNKAGDVIRAHGSAIYKRDGDKWVAVAPQGFRATPTPEYAAGAPRPVPEKMLQAMSAAIANAPPETSAATREVISQELGSAYAAIQARLARVKKGYAIAAGPSGGQYLRLVQALGDDRPNVVPLVTAGGEENLRLVREGRASLGLVQGDTALLAYEGKGPFAQEGPYTSLRAIGSLYPEPVHVIVRADSDVKTVAQLKGKRVGIGVPGSASRTTAVALLQAHGVPLDQLGKAVELPLNEALVALRQKEIDGLVQVIGAPADSIRDATADVPLRLLALDEAAVRALVAQSPAYFALVLPKGTYAQQAADVPTIATAAVMVAATELTNAEVADITQTLFARGSDLVARGSAQGAQLSPANARQGLAVPLHAAAESTLAELTKGQPTAPAQAPRP